MAGLDVKVSQLGEVIVASDNDLLNLVTYDEQNQTYVSGKVKASTMKDYMIGDTDISELGDGTPTGAIDAVNDKIEDNVIPTMTKNGAHNLLPFDIPYIKSVNTGGTWIGNVYTRNEATFTLNANGTVTCSTNGQTLSANTSMSIVDVGSFRISNVVLKGCPSGGSANTYFLAAYDNGAWVSPADTGNGYTSVGEIRAVAITLKAGQVIDNLTFEAMLVDPSDTDDTFASYAKTNRELTEELGPVFFEIPNVATDNGTVNIFGLRYGRVYQLQIVIYNATAWASGSGGRINFSLPSSIARPSVTSVAIGLNLVTAQIAANGNVILQNNSAGSISANSGQTAVVTYISRAPISPIS